MSIVTNKQIELAIKEMYDLAPEDIIQDKGIKAIDVYRQMDSEERKDIREHIYLTNNK